MRAERISVLILWGIGILLTGAAIVYGLVVATVAVVKLAAAVVAASMGLVLAILNHALARLKEAEMEQLRRKEENYKEIVSLLGDYIRDPETHRDKLATASLLSWVVGSSDVVHKAVAFIDSSSPEDRATSLEKLLIAMRADLGLASASLMNLSVRSHFPPVESRRPGHL